MQDKAEAQDETQTDITAGNIENWKTYKITAPNGLFVNGKQHKTGSTIELPADMAANFAAIGDVEDES